MSSNQLNSFRVTEAFSVDGGRFLFGTEQMAQIARNVFLGGKGKIQMVLAVETPKGLVVTNPLVVLGEQ